MASSPENPRYEGRPLVRFLELYVLWCIGELAPNHQARAEAMAPKLAQLYGVSGAWHEIIATTMEFPSSLRDSIRELWAKNTEIARQSGQVLEPQQFAEMFIDTNLLY